MTGIASLCVFCGSRLGTDPRHADQAARLGTLLAERGIRLIYGGGGIGLMGILAEAVLQAGGHVVGVIPGFLRDLEVGHPGLSELIVVDSMHERKRRMFDLSDGFVILPGGLGTLDEALEIRTWRQLKLHEKPVIVVNIGGYWSAFDDLIARTVEGGFADQRAQKLCTWVGDVEEVLPAMATSPQPDITARADRL